MTDLFAVMAEPRRPWFAPDKLKAKFLRLSASLHPDRLHGCPATAKQEAQRRFTELNTAYRCLTHPQQRLKHLLELETGAPPPHVDQIAPDLMEDFVEIASLCRSVDAFLAKKSSAGSPLLQVGFFAESQQWMESLTVAREKVQRRQDALLQRVEALDGRWMENQNQGRPQPEEITSELAEVYRLLGYVQRWGAQLQERVVQLSL